MQFKLTFASIALGPSSCASPKLKAPPPQVSAFLVSEPVLKDQRKISPFALSGGSAVSDRQKIYIAPVSISHLRAASKSLAKNGNDPANREREAQSLAIYTRQQFVKAFTNSPNSRYQVTSEYTPDALVLQLAITELNHNTFVGAIGRFALSFATVPGAEAALASVTRGLKGNIAMEGKLREGDTRRVIYQFADQEESRANLILPVHDFARYGQAREAIRAWAKQFEEVTRVSPGTKVKDVGVLGIF